jgi:ADP-ribosylglycohydrolase
MLDYAQRIIGTWSQRRLTVSEQERARALLLGLALGDALGWPIEFLPMHKIRMIYGPNGIQEPPIPAEITDDTQTAIVLIKTLIDVGEAAIDDLMKVFVDYLIEFGNSHVNTRAPGHTVTEAIRTLETGIPWQEAGVPHAKGCGSAIRAAAAGYLYQSDPDRLREVAHATGVATHSHPVAQAGALGAAYLVKLALDGAPPDEYPDRLLDFAGGISPEFDESIASVKQILNHPDEFTAITHLGDGWVANETIAMAMFCAARHPNDYEAAVRRAVNIPGDSDSVGCITGGIVAARVSMQGIPLGWVHQLEPVTRAIPPEWLIEYEGRAEIVTVADYLKDLADQLTDKKLALYGES